MITTLHPTKAEDVTISNIRTIKQVFNPKATNLVLVKLGEEQSTIIANTRQAVYKHLNSKNNYIKGVALLEVDGESIKKVDISFYYENFVFPALKQEKIQRGTLHLAEVM